MQIDWTSYGLAVLLARRQRNLRQRECARQLGISRQTLSYIERGRERPRMRTLDKITALLNVSTQSHRKKKEDNQ